MPAQSCTVNYRDSNGIAHSVQVSAESLFEAAVRGLAEFRKAELIDCTQVRAIDLEVTVRPPATTHNLPLKRLLMWLNMPGGRGPKEFLDKEKLRALVPWLCDNAGIT